MSCGKRRYTRHGKAARYQTDWRTPAKYIAPCREVLGRIDLDPASSRQANETVGAARFYAKRDKGQGRPWGGLVFVNPPNDRQGKLVREYWSRACEHALHGGPGSAVLWAGFSLEQLRTLQDCPLMTTGQAPPKPSFWPRVVIDERIRWIDGRTGKPGKSPGQGNFFALLGGDEEMRQRFRRIFSELGDYHPGRFRARAERDLSAEICDALRDGPLPGAELARRVRARRQALLAAVGELVRNGRVLRRGGQLERAAALEPVAKVPARDLWRKENAPPRRIALPVAPQGLQASAGLTRPRSMAECPAGPCPWLGCRHHLYLEERDGELLVTWPELLSDDSTELSEAFDWDRRETCSLRAAARGPMSTYEIGQALNWHRSTVEKVLRAAVAKIAASESAEGLAELLEANVAHPGT